MLNIQTKELKPFEVSKETVDRLVAEAIQIFEKYGHPYKEDAVRKLIETAIKQKSEELIPLLQNVDGWDADNLHVHLMEELDLQKDKSLAYSFFNNMVHYYGNKERILVEAKVDDHTYNEWNARRANFRSIRNWFCEHVNASGSNPFTAIVNENNYTETKFGGYTYDQVREEIQKCEEALNQMPGGYTTESNKRWDNFTEFCCHFKYIREELINENTADFVNRLFPDIRAREGQRTTKIVNKFFNLYPEAKEMKEMMRVPNRDENGEIIRTEDGEIAGFHNEEQKTFNKRMVEYTECIKQIKTKRHFLISVNPIDYLTMSFGNSWASCHTPDRNNIRKRGDHYHGMYCGGTLSYMLDTTTAVCYTVDKGYDGNRFELQDKIDRNLIHYHDGIFIQGRLYPQSNDGSQGNTLYKQFRDIEERVISEGLGAPNIWNYRNGTSACQPYRTTAGRCVHYRDYDSYETVGVCRIKVDERLFRGGSGDPNMTYERMLIGHTGIDIYTGAPVHISGSLTAVYTRYGENRISTGNGTEISADNAVYVENKDAYYNKNDVFFCSYHKRYELKRSYGDLMMRKLYRNNGDLEHICTAAAVTNDVVSINSAYSMFDGDSYAYRNEVEEYEGEYYLKSMIEAVRERQNALLSA